MKRRKLGKSGLEISPLCFGGNVFGWTVNRKKSFQLLDAFVDAGFNFIDTADVYSRWAPGNQGGESETIIGEWFKKSGHRKDVIIATKVGLEMGQDMKGLSRNYIFRAVEDSLKRLQTDTIDLYQSHVDDPDTPLEETLQAFQELIKQGKIRAIGASNYGAARLAESLEISKKQGLPAYDSLQPLYNLYDREDFEKNLEPFCREKGLGVITYFSLASGFLTGKYRSSRDLSKSIRGGMVEKYLTSRGNKILKSLDKTAEQLNSTPAKVSLAWLLSKPSITAPIASVSNMEQLKELIEATKLRLDGTALELLSAESAPCNHRHFQATK
jgi:aryl-alcohol dehydrogenase-like predicted oxidoreductase